jgi:hypothetical protein
MHLTRNPPVTLLIASVLVGLVLLFSFVPGARSQVLRGSWTQVDLSNILPSSVLPLEVALADNTTAWLVGIETIMPGAKDEGRVYKLKRQGGKWGLSAQYDFPDPIRCLKATQDGSVRVVASGRCAFCSDYSQILRKDANGWHEETGKLEGVFLSSISMLPGGQEGWAAGVKIIPVCKFTCSESYLLHFKNGSWVSDPTVSAFRQGFGNIDFSVGVGYAAGEVIRRYDGQNWTEVSLPQLPPGPTVPPNQEACPGLYFACQSFGTIRVLNPDEFWVFGRRYSSLSESEPLLLHMNHGRWQVVMPGNSVLENRPAGTQPLMVSSFSMGSDGFGFLAASPIQYWADGALPQIIQVTPDGSLSYEQLPQIEHTTLTGISNTDADHALAFGLQWIQVVTEHGLETRENPVLLSYVNDESQAPTPTPATPAPPTGVVGDKHYNDGIYFPVVGHNLRGGFLRFWAQNGGLRQFGYPLTEEFTEESPTDGKNYTVQYFERARMEWHPLNSPPYDVLLGLLGRTITHGRESELPFVAVPIVDAGSGGVAFPQTGHVLAGPFLSYWQQHGGLAVYGYPISEAFMETSSTDGKPYLVQYFERNRFEIHPELAEPFRVSLGLLGVQILSARGWIH